MEEQLAAFVVAIVVVLVAMSHKTWGKPKVRKFVKILQPAFSNCIALFCTVFFSKCSIISCVDTFIAILNFHLVAVKNWDFKDFQVSIQRDEITKVVEMLRQIL